MPKPPHSVTDHAMGALAAHEHGQGEFDHDHDADFYLDGNSRSLESVDLVSMGLDIGSSSTQVAFSRLTMRGPGEHRALRGRARDRQTLYLSPIMPTPFADGMIEDSRLRLLIDKAFIEAGLTPDDIETGVVILTGEAATRANAAAIAHLVAEDIGDLVCAAAGHHMEAMLAAHGSGAVEASRVGDGQRILVIDVGGATAKFAVVDAGRVISTAAMAVGGRLLVIDRANGVTRLDAAGAEHASRAGFDWKVGDVIEPDARAVVAERMADAIVAAVRAPTSNIASQWLTKPLGDVGKIDGVMFAGGVGEYVYQRETRDFGDLGRALGLALRRRMNDGAFGAPLLPPGECIRATVLGASEHSVQISGDTIFISAHAALLPRRNLPVLRPALDLTGDIASDAVADAIRAHRAAFDRDKPAEPFALSLPFRGAPDYARVRALAVGVVAGLVDIIAAGAPVYLIVEGDIAQTLGGVIKHEIGIASEILAIDGITARDFDFVDIGRVRLPSNTVPVTIKSVLFGAGVKPPKRR
jgi:ethanolamine utilization protein EutA